MRERKPSPGGGGSTAKPAGWGDTADDTRAGASSGERVHPTPDLRSDPPPPGEGGQLVLLGEFGRAQGLRGEVRLKSHTGDPLAIARYGPLVTRDGRAVVLSGVRRAAGEAADMLVAQVAGVATREAAEALNRMRLFIPREKLPPPEDEDEFLLADLIGMTAEDEAGRRLGAVRGVPNFGGGDLLEIAPAGGAPSGGSDTLLVPFTKACVPIVEVARRRIVVMLPVETEAVETMPVETAADEPGP